MPTKPYLSITLRQRPEGKKTDTYDVCGQDGSYLGQIKFYPSWRKYIFHSDQAIFDQECLYQIADFCKMVTGKWRQGLLNGKDKQAG